MKKGLLLASLLYLSNLVLAETKDFDSFVTGAAAGEEIATSPILAIVVLLVVVGLIIFWITRTKK